MTFPNQNAEDAFLASGLPDTEQVRRVIRQEATYLMNVTGGRYSDAVRTACYWFPKVTSPTAAAILAEVSK